MSMLAEPRRKQRFTLNPRGKFWTEDKNKFGQKMLEKMGWTSGKGLGAKGTGITESLKVKYKNDASGFGFEENDNQWTQHEKNFTKLLENLTAENSPDSSNDETSKPKKSLEELSKTSKSRLHYHKFTKSKDISKISEKDLMSIFGKKAPENKINAGLVNHGFENFDTELKSSKTEVCELGSTNFGFIDFDQNESETEKDNLEVYNNDNKNLLNIYKQMFVKSKDNTIEKQQEIGKKEKENNIIEVFAENCSRKSDENELESNKKGSKRNRDNIEDVIDGKRKSKLLKIFKNKTELEGIDNLACEANSEEQQLEEVITNMNHQIDNYENEIENEINERKSELINEMCVEVCKNDSRKKKQRKRINKVGIEQIQMEVCAKKDEPKHDKGEGECIEKVQTILSDTQGSEIQSVSDVKKSKRENKNLENETENIYEIQTDYTQNEIDVKTERQKRKMQKLETIIEIEEQDQSFERKRNKKKRKQCKDEKTDTVEEITESNVIFDEIKEKHKNDKRKNKLQEQSVNVEKDSEMNFSEPENNEKVISTAELTGKIKPKNVTNIALAIYDLKMQKLAEQRRNDKEQKEREMMKLTGRLKLRFVGANLDKIPGYGAEL